MGTSLRRIQISLPDDVEKAFSEMAELQQLPMSKVIVSFLSDLEPQIRELNKLHRVMKEGNIAEAKRTIAHMVGDGMADFLMEMKEQNQSRGKRP